MPAQLHKPRSTPPPLLHAGATLGKYKLIQRLAIGGMAEIYLAQTSGIERFEKLVVLKRMLPQYGTNAEFVKMFLNEARLAATLHHPNIAQVYDIGVADENYFFTMEFVHGKNLRQIINKAKKFGTGFPLEHAISIVIGVCAGLHRAHEKRDAGGELLGVVHRDVSPSNVIVSFDGCAKVVDFGIASAARGEMATNSRSLKGKINYMSPEQCMGEPLDRRSDVFAIGNMIYELSTGDRLFPKIETEYALLTKIVTGTITRPSELVEDYPPFLEEIVMRALRKNPDERYATAEELQLDLEEFAQDNMLSTSAIRVSRFLETLYSKQVRQWKIARDAGETLEEHIARTMAGDREVLGAEKLRMADVQMSDARLLGIEPSDSESSDAGSRSSSDTSGETDERLSELEAQFSRGHRVRRWLGGAIVVASLVAVGLGVIIVRSIMTSDDDAQARPAAAQAPDGENPPERTAPEPARAAEASPEEAQPAVTPPGETPPPRTAQGAATSADSESAEPSTEGSAAGEPTETTPAAVPTADDSTEPVDERATARRKSKKNKRTKKKKKSRKRTKSRSKTKSSKKKRDDKWDQKSPLLPP